jgi:CheY-like chemotaxis protein
LIGRADVDVCVIDLVMPGLSGAELGERVRKAAPNVAIIAISGYAVPELFQSVALSGAFACLRKPFDAAELAQIVAEARRS